MKMIHFQKGVLPEEQVFLLYTLKRTNVTPHDPFSQLLLFVAYVQVIQIAKIVRGCRRKMQR